MKTKIVFLLSAIVCLASCNKQDLITPEHDENEGKEGDYRIEIVDLQSPTKSSPSTVQLSLANLTKASSKRVSAQLKKKSGSNWVDVTTGVVYSWSASSSDSKKFDGSGTVNQSCDISAKATGSGTITVSANLNSTVVATQDVPVTVSDDRALSWSNATTSITSGEVKTATLNSNFSCTATISSNNGSFLVGTSSTNLSSTASVTFSTNQTKTIYYKYTGSEQTTIKIEAQNGSIKTSQNINVTSPSEPVFYLTFESMDNRHINQGGGDLYITYKLQVQDSKYGWYYEPGREFDAEVIDWGYTYNSSGSRQSYHFDQDHSYSCSLYEGQGEMEIDVTLSVRDDDYQRMGNTFNLLVKVTLDDGRQYLIEYIPTTPTPTPDPDPDPTPTILDGLYYSTDGYTYRTLDACGTYSRSYGITTSGSYDGECYYFNYVVGEEMEENGAVCPIELVNNSARFKYYENNVEKSVSVSESSVTRLTNNMNRTTRYNSQYPYTDGSVYTGSHASYVTLTLKLQNGTSKKVWGYITESDDFGDMCRYYPHYR